MVAEEIAIENKEKQLEGTYKSHESRRIGSVQMNGSNDEKKSHISPTHTREQIAKLLGVGVGMVARYDAVMKILKFILRRKKWIIYLINLGYMIFLDY